MERKGWDEFLSGLDFEQGEHCTLIGPTGCGKTTLAKELMMMRGYSAVFACKPRDPVVSELRQEGHLIIKEWPPPEPRENFPRVVLWPRIDAITDLKDQKARFERALMDIYQSHGWTVVFDEARYITQFLQLSELCEMLWMQGRSLGVSVICCTQRPYWIPLTAYDQATHLFIWKDSDERNIKRLCEMAPVSGNMLRAAMGDLAKHEFIYVNTRTEEWTVSAVGAERGEIAV